MSVSKNTLKMAAAALGLVLAAGSAQASGVPLSPSQSCGLQFYQTNMDGTLVVKTRQAEPGSYFVSLTQEGRANLVIAELSGYFQGARGGEIELARVALNRRDFGRYNMNRGGRAPAEVNRGVYEFESLLRVYDTRGRLTCSSNQMAVLGAGALNAPNQATQNPRESYGVPRGPSYTAPTPAPAPVSSYQPSQPTPRQPVIYNNPRESRSGRGPN